MYKLEINIDELLQIKASAGIRILEANRMLRMCKSNDYNNKFVESMEWEIKTNENIIEKCVDIERVCKNE